MDGAMPDPGMGTPESWCVRALGTSFARYGAGVEITTYHGCLYRIHWNWAWKTYLLRYPMMAWLSVVLLI